MPRPKRTSEVECHVCHINYVPANKQSTPSIRYTCPDCREKVSLICPVCDVKFERHKSRLRQRKTLCCSVKCKGLFQRKDWNDLSRNNLKQRWVNEFGVENFVCKRCGHDKAYNIALHHIKYVSQGGDNSPENLEPLCLNCHGIEHYGRGKDLKE